MLRLTIFGGFSLAGPDGAEIPLKSRKAKGLLAYLALSPGQTRSREEIMALLWSDRGEVQARASLRQVLSGLRKDFGRAAMTALIVTNDAVALDPDKVTIGAARPGEELLAGFHLHDPAFEDWLRDERLRQEDAVVSDAGAPEPPLPDKPSIAVLPFVNMSGDESQDYFGDGIAEDIITALSKIPSLLVMARNSTFAYKRRAVDVKQVSREQGVRYILEGSVRTAGTRVRVTAQLIDATTGHHPWAERYDRDLQDIFAVQDEITRKVVTALDVHLSRGEQARSSAGSTRNLEAWGCTRRATELLERGTLEGLSEARRLCKEAIEHDPNYPAAWVQLGWLHHHVADVGVAGTSEDGHEAAFGPAIDCAKRALDLDPGYPEAYSLLGTCHLSRNEHDRALAMAEKAIAMAPNHADILATSAIVYIKSGQPTRGLELIRKAMRLCPINSDYFPWVLGTAYRLTGQGGLAVETFEAAIEQQPDFLALHVGLASTLGELGRVEDTTKPVSEVLRLDPGFSIRKYMERVSYKDPAMRARFQAGLRKAGLPE
jgi:TolB-like protein/Flp pilus assembly protein TadD